MNMTMVCNLLESLIGAGETIGQLVFQT